MAVAPEVSGGVNNSKPLDQASVRRTYELIITLSTPVRPSVRPSRIRPDRLWGTLSGPL